MAEQTAGIKITAQDATGGAFRTVNQNLGSLQNAAIQVSTAMAGVGVSLSIGAMVAYAKSLVDGVDALNDLKDATGASIENISALEDVAVRSGASLDTVSTSLIKLNQALNSAKPGSAAEQAITAIGLSVKDLKTLDPAEAFRQIAVSLDGYADDANKARITQELFGKSLKEVAPLLKDLAEKGSLVGTVTTEQAEAAERFNKELFAMGKNAQDVGRYMVGDLVTGINAAAKAYRESGLIAGIQTLVTGDDQYKNNKALVEQTEQMLNLEQAIAGFKKQGYAEDSRVIVNARLQLAAINEELKTTVAMRQQLTGAAAAAVAPPKPSLPTQPDPAGLKEAQDAAKRALAAQNKELAEQSKLIAELSGYNADYEETVQRYTVMLGKGTLSQAAYNDAVVALVAKQPGIKASADAQAKAQELLAKSYAEINKEIEKYVETQRGLLTAAFDEVDKAQAAYDAHGKLASAIQQETLARLENARAVISGTGEDLSVIDAQIAAKKRLIDILKNGEVRQAGEDAAKATQAAFDKSADQIGQALTDQIMEGGRNGADYITNLFRTMVLRPVIQAVTAPIANAVTGSLLGTAANAATGVSASSGLLGNAASLASLGSSFGEGFMATLGGSSVSGGGAAALLSGGSSMAGMVGAAAPYALAALAVAKLLSGPGFTSATDSGRARIDYSAAGVAGNAYSTTGSAEQITAMTASTNALAKSYFDTAKALGISAIQGAFEVGTNTGREGSSPNTVIGATFGSNGYSSGEVSSADTAGLALAANRAVLTALQASELPGYLAEVFNGITASTASQDQITSALAFAQSLKTVRDGLLETRTPLQILKDSVSDGFSTLGTSADTFKADFVAAIDSGLNAENLAKWQALQTTMTSLATASDAADTALNKVLQSLQTKGADLQDQYDKLTLSQDAYRAKTIAGYTEQEKAQALVNFALEDSIAAYNAQKEAVTAAADAAKTAAQAYYDAAATSASSALTAVNKAIEAQRKIYQVQVSAAQSAVTEISSVFNVLKSNIDALYGSTSGKADQGNAFIDQALATAPATGYLPDSTQLADAITAARAGVDSTIYASQRDADFARLALAGKLDQLKNISGQQLTGADRALSVAQSQLTALDDIANSAQAQLDATTGIDTALLSVADALRAFGIATGALANARQSQGLDTVASDESLRLNSIQTYIKTLDWGTPAADASSARTLAAAAAQYGVSQKEIAASMSLPLADVTSLFASVGIPAFDRGTNLIPQDMLAVVHQGEAIIPAAYNPANGGGMGNTARLEALVEGLTKEVQRLQSVVAAGNDSNDRIANTVAGNQTRPLLVEIAPA